MRRKTTKTRAERLLEIAGECAVRYGLPREWGERLQGNTPSELMRAAARLAATEEAQQLQPPPRLPGESHSRYIARTWEIEFK